MRIARLPIPVMTLVCLVIAASVATGQDRTQTIPTGRSEPDFIEPAGLDAHVASSDLIIIARLRRRLEPRVQTNTLTVRGQPVTSTLVFARYLVHIERVLKTSPERKSQGEIVVEQAVGDASLAAFKQGLPDLGSDELMLFLQYYPPGQTFQVGGWNAQFKKSTDGAVQAIQTKPAAKFVQDHPLLGAAENNRSSSYWATFVDLVEAFVPKNRR